MTKATLKKERKKEVGGLLTVSYRGLAHDSHRGEQPGMELEQYLRALDNDL